MNLNIGEARITLPWRNFKLIWQGVEGGMTNPGRHMVSWHLQKPLRVAF